MVHKDDIELVEEPFGPPAPTGDPATDPTVDEDEGAKSRRRESLPLRVGATFLGTTGPWHMGPLQMSCVRFSPSKEFARLVYEDGKDRRELWVAVADICVYEYL